MLRKFRAPALAAAAAAVLAALCSNAALAVDTTPIVLTFSTVGDSRAQPATAGATTQDARWLQNSKAWSRILREAAAKKSQLMLFNGDMVMAYGNADSTVSASVAMPTAATTAAYKATNDYVKATAQYAFWRGMVAPFMEQGMYVVPVAGNHEVQCNATYSSTCGTGPSYAPTSKFALASNEKTWRENMSDLILDTTRISSMFGATVAANLNLSSVGTTYLDGQSTDQTGLSFSFDFKGSHFAIVNTDPVGGDSTAPTNWLKADLAAAAGRGITRMFVFGHKPAYTYDYLGTGATPAAGLDLYTGTAATVAKRDAFWDTIETYHATYFCGHEHTFNVQQPRLSSSGSAWQVLVGGGGSPFDPATSVHIYDRFYSWATVSVHQAGGVDINAWGFDETYGPTKLLATINLQ